MSFLVLGCAFFFEKGFVPMLENPFFGYSESTIISFGAKQGDVMTKSAQWRILTANAVHAGVIHICINVAILGTLYRVERYHGFFTSMLTFLFGGTFGFLLSVMITPGYTSCGGNGGNFALIGYSLVRYIVSWKTGSFLPWLIVSIIGLVITVIMGLLPFNDNFVNIGGLLIGILISLTLLPNIEASKCVTYLRSIVAFLAFPIAAVLFSLSLALYLRKPDTFICNVCAKALCVDFSSTRWCPGPFY